MIYLVNLVMLIFLGSGSGGVGDLFLLTGDRDLDFLRGGDRRRTGDLIGDRRRAKK